MHGGQIALHVVDKPAIRRAKIPSAAHNRVDQKGFEKWELPTLTNHLGRFPVAVQSVSVVRYFHGCDFDYLRINRLQPKTSSIFVRWMTERTILG